MLVESWSGYALECSGSPVNPFVVSAVDSTGHTNLTCNTGAIQFWFKPNWSSASLANGNGPGVNAPLIELSVVGNRESVAAWSLQVSSDGTMLALLGGANGGPEALLKTGISWQADKSHLVTLNFSPKGTALFIDGTLVATGGGTLAIPPAVGAVTVGSGLAGTDPADGAFEELCSYSHLLNQKEVSFIYEALSSNAALGPISQAEYQRWLALRTATRSALRASPMGLGGGNSPLSPLCDCATGGQVYLTNVVATLTTNDTMAVSFNLAGGTNFVWYGVYSTTNLANPQWIWLTNTYTCTLVSLINQPWQPVFYAVCAPAPTMVVAWGDNGAGQCDVPPGLTNAIGVAGGFDFSLALKADGTVVAWGKSIGGVTNIPANLTNVTSIAAGDEFALALLANGTVVAWGTNDVGQTNVPIGLTNVMTIAAGYGCGFALRNDGSVVAWGYNYYGQTNVPALGAATQVAGGAVQGAALLANGTVAMWARYNYSGYPYYWGLTNVPAGLSNVVSIAAGGYHTLALKADGTVAAWGAGAGAINTAWDDDGQSIVPAGLSNVVAVAGCTVYSLALQSDGTVTAWGDDRTGQLDFPDRLTGVRTIGAGGGHGLAIRYGQLTPVIYDEPDSLTVAPGTNVTFSVRARGVAGLTYQWQLNGVNLPGATNSSLTLSNVQSSVAGNYQVVISSSSGSVTSNIATLTVPHPAYGPGLISGWGSNTNGELVWPTDATNVLSLAAGKAHGIVAQDNGLVVSWGSYWTGFNFVAVTAPPLLTNAIAVAAGSRHDLALKANGIVVAWGWNDFGQTNVPGNATNVIAISAGGAQSLALNMDGTILQWGQTNAPVPAGLTNVTAIASGTNFHLALLKNSTVVAWGANDYGQTNIPANLSNVVAIAAGGAHALALKIDGTVAAWGAWTNVPANLTNVMNVAAGENHSLALKNNGTVICWGDNTDGQTNFTSGLSNVKLFAGGGAFTLASKFLPLVSYPVKVPKDLLLIYNTNSVDSKTVLDYYLAHRQNIGGANVLGIGWTNSVTPGYFETITPTDLTNHLLNPVHDWLVGNPTKRPQFVILFMDVPGRVSTNTAFPIWPIAYFAAPASSSVCMQFQNIQANWQPFVTHLNMGMGNLVNRTNDCIAYINKLANLGVPIFSNSPILSASAGNYGNTNFILDDVRNGMTCEGCENYSLQTVISSATNGLLAFGIPSTEIHYYDRILLDNVFTLTNHCLTMTNVAGYVCWGTHGDITPSRTIDGTIKWYGNSGWWLINTEESFNGQQIYTPGAQGSFNFWFSSTAFGGINYSNTPIGAVTTVDEPGLPGKNNNSIYFGLWATGKNFGICSWHSRGLSSPLPFLPVFQAVGDPLITR